MRALFEYCTLDLLRNCSRPATNMKPAGVRAGTRSAPLWQRLVPEALATWLSTRSSASATPRNGQPPVFEAWSPKPEARSQKPSLHSATTLQPLCRHTGKLVPNEASSRVRDRANNRLTHYNAHGRAGEWVEWFIIVNVLKNVLTQVAHKTYLSLCYNNNHNNNNFTHGSGFEKPSSNLLT